MRRNAHWFFHPPALLPALLIVLAGGWAFSPVIGAGWIWDDNIVIVDNPLLRDWAGLGKIWAGIGTPDYFPLTSTVQWMQWHLWGERPLGYHLTNLALHLLSSVIFWRLLRMILPGSEFGPWTGGLLFAVHPLMAESVAWVAELKNTLSLPPLLLAMGAWVDWVGPPFSFRMAEAAGLSGRTGSSKLRASFPVLLALFWFLVAALCKTSVVMFPCVLLLYGWWRRGAIGGRDLLASGPFFAISLVLGLVTVWFQRHHGMEAGVLPLGDLGSRAATAGLTAIFYLAKLLIPFRLLAVYARWPVDPPSARQFLPGLAVIALFGWLWVKRSRSTLFGLGCFLVNLTPVLGFVPVAYFHISWVADHFCYLPSLGVFGLAAAACGRDAAFSIKSRAGDDRPLSSGLRFPPARLGGLKFGGRRSLLCGLGAVSLAALLAWESRRYSAVFRDEEALWSHTLAREPRSWTALNNLGKTLLKKGRAEEAVPLMEKALALGPAYVAGDINLNLSMALAMQGRPFEAIRRCQEAIRLRPEDAGAHGNLGNLYSELGRLSEAIAEYEEAVRLQPHSAAAHNNLGTALTSAGRLPEAIAQAAEAVRLDPRYVDARYNLAVALGHARRYPEALAEFEKVVRLAPGRADAHNNLGIVLAGLGRLAEAKAEFEAALRLNPNFEQAVENLARANRAGAPVP